ncbi:helix-turn-helix domain-containing protein [Phototrophicus methaneseepsis]|uniref:Helix-turn-helix domain-containing protein n=1 Tax=Phototrophicus methaneseepsis TaxID=2710758 RepID=A0A7S8IE64_9CHLR|nr:helix-turn-helix domain-containing protein [Phototrophicus methaneseepsis]QPC82094.1 helix-turn-helix domain-containing protein [Phototrophicus methaneseepsis]
MANSLSKLQARTMRTGFVGQIERTGDSTGIETVDQVRASMQQRIEQLEMQLEAARRQIGELKARNNVHSDDGHWMTPKEAAQALGVSQPTISRAIRGVGTGRIKSKIIGGGQKAERYLVDVSSYIPARKKSRIK